MSLHPCIRGSRGNSFCGPAAIVSAFGVDVDAAAKAIRDTTGKPNVFGVLLDDLENAMSVFGDVQQVEEVTHDDGYTRPWHGSLERLAPLLEFGTYVVAFNDHYVALDTERMEVCDNHTIYPLPVSRYKFRRKHVVRIWAVVPEVRDAGFDAFCQEENEL